MLWLLALLNLRAILNFSIRNFCRVVCRESVAPVGGGVNPLEPIADGGKEFLKAGKARQGDTGIHGSRTHHGQARCPSSVLKTEKSTGTHALPLFIIQT